MKQAELLRRIPRVDAVIGWLADAGVIHTPPLPPETEAVQETLGLLREEILSGARAENPEREELFELVRRRMRRNATPNLRRVINATGIVLHTNLGRARLGERAADAVREIALHYSNLEYDLDAGERGSRHTLVEGLIARLTGAESAMVVNNNAAAVLLILNTIAKGREVVVSRGELVEIGDSFRIPAIIEQSGSVIREVGTTNKTHLRDYESAIDPDRTAALLKVHTSNFRIVGFSECPSIKELAQLARTRGLPLVFDAGSGLLFDLQGYGIADEPNVARGIADGADVVCFSGDKLLGGPQAGVIAGKKEWIGAMRKNQLSRALRIDKFTLAALEATLRSYLEGAAEREIPTLQMIAATREALFQKADMLCSELRVIADDCFVEIVEESGQVGGGAVPGQMLPTFAAALRPVQITVAELERRLRHAEPPVIARISKDRLLLDVRTLTDEEIPQLAACVARALRG